MTSADICQCVRLGTALLISIFCADDELYNVSHKWHPMGWGGVGGGRGAISAGEFGLGVQIRPTSE